MKINNTLGLLLITLFVSQNAFAAHNYDTTKHEYSTNYDSDKARLDDSVDYSTANYTAAKELVEYMDTNKGSDKEKNALYAEANTILDESKEKYDKVIKDIKDSYKEYPSKPKANDACIGSTTVITHSINTSQFDTVEKGTRKVEELYYKIKTLQCKFDNSQDAQCAVMLSADQMKTKQNGVDTTNIQNNINDNIQNIINNTGSGSCTQTYNHVTHSYDCL